MSHSVARACAFKTGESIPLIRRLVREGGKCERAISEVCGGGIEATRRTIGADFRFFKIPRTLSRPRGTPVCWASTVASAWQLQCEWKEPC